MASPYLFISILCHCPSWGLLGPISLTFYTHLLCAQITKAWKRQSSCQSFFRFWDLHMQKLLLEHWWNWPLISFPKLWTKNQHQNIKALTFLSKLIQKCFRLITKASEFSDFLPKISKFESQGESLIIVNGEPNLLLHC